MNLHLKENLGVALCIKAEGNGYLPGGRGNTLARLYSQKASRQKRDSRPLTAAKASTVQ